MNFFREVKAELMQRIYDDDNSWFPEILALEQQCDTVPDSPLSTHGIDTQDAIEDKVNDLISMFVIHLKGDYDMNLGQAVLLALDSIKKDIAQNNRIRLRILLPLYQALITNS
jgi:regulator of cell morphogenesis and NO signaling